MKKPVAPQVVSEINVTPMVDVMLVLLIIFIVITPLHTKGVTVEYVKAKNPIAMQNADKVDATLISMLRNGQSFLRPGNRQLSLDELPTKVQDLLPNKLDQTVYLRADAR